MAARPRSRADRRSLVKDPRFCLLAKRDQAAEFLASNDDLPALEADAADWGRVPVAAVLHFLGSADELAARFGCRILAAAGGYFAVLVPLAQLVGEPGAGTDWLIAHPALLEVSVGRLGRPGSHADAPPALQPLPPRAAVGLAKVPAPTGKGVLLGVVDTVFDWAHPAFLDQDGLSRVRWIWDVNAVADDPAVPTGRRYTAEELRRPGFTIDQWELHVDATADAALARIWRTHGTIVSSIAAGRATDGSFAGVAPDADLAFVGAGNETTGRIGNAADVLAGLHALLSGPGPVVANLSTADTLGPHDGALLGERLLDEMLLRPGRAVVVCAGNFGLARRAPSGAGYRHDHAVVPACDGAAQFTLRYDAALDLPDVAEIWLDSAKVPDIEIIGTIDDGGPLTFSVPVDETPVEAAVPLLPGRPDCGRVLAVLTRGGPHDRWCVSTFFRPASVPGHPPFFPASTWRFAVRGVRGLVHAWLDRNNLAAGGWQAPLPRPDWGSLTIGSPATARRAIAVGGVTAAGQRLAAGTGVGPCLDGRLKPDLAVRGEGVLAAAPAAAQPWGDSGSGTSIAAPLVAGSVALLFEAWGGHARYATWYDIRQALLRGAVMPGDQTGWDPALGWGTLDMARALAPPPRDVDLWIARTPDDDGAEPLVREFLSDSPDIAVQAPAADGTVAVLVSVRNRGRFATANVTVRLFLGDVGAAGPPDGTRGSPWTTRNIVAPAQTIDLLTPGATAVVPFQLQAGVGPAILLAVADNRDDPLPDDALPSSCNNIALRTLGRGPGGRASAWSTIALRGSGAGDGVWLRVLGTGGRLALRGLPVRALPWREAAIYEQAGRQLRPNVGERGADPVAARTITLDGGEAIRTRTDVDGAARLALARGRVTIEAAANELWLPRLRLAQGATLRFQVSGTSDASAAPVGLAVFADGRRAGGAVLGSPT